MCRVAGIFVIAKAVPPTCIARGVWHLQDHGQAFRRSRLRRQGGCSPICDPGARKGRRNQIETIPPLRWAAQPPPSSPVRLPCAADIAVGLQNHHLRHHRASCRCRRCPRRAKTFQARNCFAGGGIRGHRGYNADRRATGRRHPASGTRPTTASARHVNIFAVSGPPRAPAGGQKTQPRPTGASDQPEPSAADPPKPRPPARSGGRASYARGSHPPSTCSIFSTSPVPKGRLSSGTTRAATPASTTACGATGPSCLLRLHADRPAGLRGRPACGGAHASAPMRATPASNRIRTIRNPNTPDCPGGYPARTCAMQRLVRTKRQERRELCLGRPLREVPNRRTKRRNSPNISPISEESPDVGARPAEEPQYEYTSRGARTAAMGCFQRPTSPTVPG